MKWVIYGTTMGEEIATTSHDDSVILALADIRAHDDDDVFAVPADQGDGQ